METLKVVRSAIRRIHNPLLGVGAAVPICEMSERIEERIKGEPS
jgi:hypothetical protein